MSADVTASAPEHASPGLLADYAYIPQIAREVERCERTVLRWMDEEEDGLPYTMLGRRRLVHIPTMRAWLLAKMKRPNSSAKSRRASARRHAI